MGDEDNKENKMKKYLIILIFICFSWADITNAHKLRAANWALGKGELEKADQIYAALPQNKKILFNRGFLEGLTRKKEEEKKYYKTLINQNIPGKEKAKVYFNLGNDLFKNGDIQAAKKYYREGLKLDPKNRKLKHNLELANNAKIRQQAPQKNQQKKDQQQKNENKPKPEQQKNAEKMLDSFKDKEQQNQMKILPKQDKKRNVEKDW